MPSLPARGCSAPCVAWAIKMMFQTKGSVSGKARREEKGRSRVLLWVLISFLLPPLFLFSFSVGSFGIQARVSRTFSAFCNTVRKTGLSPSMSLSLSASVFPFPCLSLALPQALFWCLNLPFVVFFSSGVSIFLVQCFAFFRFLISRLLSIAACTFGVCCLSLAPLLLFALSVHLIVSALTSCCSLLFYSHPAVVSSICWRVQSRFAMHFSLLFQHS